MCINCDWLQYSVLLSSADAEFIIPDGYRMEVCTGTNVFAQRAIIYDCCGVKCLTLCWQPHSKQLNPRLMTVQVANELLYNGCVSLMFDLLLSMVDCEFNSIGRFDVCLDFEVDDRLLGIIRRLGSGAMYLEGKSEGSVWWHTTSFRGVSAKFPHCLSWGSQNTQIRPKLYNKSREQNLMPPVKSGAMPDKPWIVSEWRRAGMDVSAIWRLEFSIHDVNRLQYEGELITLETVLNPAVMIGLYCDLFRRRFVVRRNQGKRTPKHNGDAIVPFLRLDFDESHFERRDVVEPMRIGENTRFVRTLVRQISEPISRCSPDVLASLGSVLISVVDDTHLDEWFCRYFDMDVRSWVSSRLDASGSGCVSMCGDDIMRAF